MQAILRYRMRTVIAAMTLFATVLAIYVDSVGTQGNDVRVIAGIQGTPLEVSLPTNNRRSSLPNGIECGVAYFEFCGPNFLRRHADARYSCRATTIVLRGPSYNDLSLERLGELNFLRELHLLNTRVTAAAIARLKHQLPHLKVIAPRRAGRRIVIKMPEPFPRRIVPNDSRVIWKKKHVQQTRPSTEITEL